MKARRRAGGSAQCWARAGSAEQTLPWCQPGLGRCSGTQWALLHCALTFRHYPDNTGLEKWKLVSFAKSYALRPYVNFELRKIPTISNACGHVWYDIMMLRSSVDCNNQQSHRSGGQLLRLRGPARSDPTDFIAAHSQFHEPIVSSYLWSTFDIT